MYAERDKSIPADEDDGDDDERQRERKGKGESSRTIALVGQSYRAGARLEALPMCHVGAITWTALSLLDVRPSWDQQEVDEPAG
jgi:hypothetical protein